MKTNIIHRTFLAVILALGSLTTAVHAIPTPIVGALSFSGTSSINGIDFLTATQFTSFEAVTVGAPGSLSGDYAGTAGAAVTVSPFIWSPANASTPIVPLWSFTSGGLTYSFDVELLHVDFVSAIGLVLSGFGTAHITGPGVEKIDTFGHWDFSAQTLGLSTFTFSSTANVPANVPDGGTTVALLGASFCGLAWVNRKRTPLKLA